MFIQYQTVHLCECLGFFFTPIHKVSSLATLSSLFTSFPSPCPPLPNPTAALAVSSHWFPCFALQDSSGFVPGLYCLVTQEQISLLLLQLFSNQHCSLSSQWGGGDWQRMHSLHSFPHHWDCAEDPMAGNSTAMLTDRGHGKQRFFREFQPFGKTY